MNMSSNPIESSSNIFPGSVETESTSVSPQPTVEIIIRSAASRYGIIIRSAASRDDIPFFSFWAKNDEKK